MRITGSTTFVEILFNVGTTALAYGLFPLLFLVFRRKPLSFKIARILLIAYPVLMWVLIDLIYLANNIPGPANAMAAVFWGVIFYGVVMRSFKKRNLFITITKSSDSGSDNSASSGPLSESAPPSPESMSPPSSGSSGKPSYCKQCGSPIDPSTKKCSGCGKQYFKFPHPDAKFFSVLLLILFAVSACLNIYQYVDTSNKIEALNDAVKQNETQMKAKDRVINNLKEENAELQNSVDFGTSTDSLRDRLERAYQDGQNGNITLSKDGETFTSNDNSFKYSGD